MTAAEKFLSPWYAGHGVIYFIAAGNPPAAIKIGVAKRDGVARRLKSIQSSNHEFIELLGVICFESGEKPMLQAERREKELHRKFALLQRIADGNVGHEWFCSSPELLAFIEENTSAPEALGLPRHVSKRATRAEV